MRLRCGGMLNNHANANIPCIASEREIILKIGLYFAKIWWLGF